MDTIETLTVNEQLYKELKRAYKKALKENKDSFFLGKYELVTEYAKYILEYLKSKFES